MSKLDATLVAGGGINTFYENGTIRCNDNSLLIAVIKNPIYEELVANLLSTINNIYNTPRPIKDDSFEVMNILIETTTKLLHIF